MREFPSGANKVRISAHGGMAPRWRRDGNEIFYAEQHKLMAVAVGTHPVFSSAVPVELFQNPALPNYDVSSDGKRFIVMVKPPAGPPLTIPLSGKNCAISASETTGKPASAPS